jgi:hypothetical protein
VGGAVHPQHAALLALGGDAAGDRLGDGFEDLGRLANPLDGGPGQPGVAGLLGEPARRAGDVAGVGGQVGADGAAVLQQVALGLVMP